MKKRTECHAPMSGGLKLGVVIIGAGRLDKVGRAIGDYSTSKSDGG